MRVGIIGGGKVGKVLAGALKRACLLQGVTARTIKHSRSLAERFATAPTDNLNLFLRSNVLFLTVPDRQIAIVAKELAQADILDVSDKVILHCSGSLDLEPLAPLAALGAHCGSLHPLQSFAGGPTELAGVYMALDGDDVAQTQAEKLARLFGGKPFYVPTAERAAYHAAAVLASNYAVAVEHLAEQLMSRWTGDAASAWQALRPLFRGTAENLLQAERAELALTGPISRGDVATVAAHLRILPPRMRKYYRILGQTTLEIAMNNGMIDKNSASELSRLLQNTEGEK